MKGNEKLAWICVLLITAVAAAPLAGAPVRGDDLFLHYYRIPVLNQLWQDGIFFARWHPDLVFGYGSPLFNFYPPLSAYLLTAFYWLWGANGPIALNFFFVVTFSLTSSGMFLAARKLYGSVGGVLATAAYCWSPYLLLQPYSRSSLSNALALAFFPWAFYALLRLHERLSWRWVGLTAVLISAIFLSHVVSSILFIAPFGFVALITAVNQQAERKQRLQMTLFALLSGVALATFFWLPAFGELDATKYAVEAGRVAYADFFADIWQWPEQTVAGVSNAALPKSIGLVQQLAGVVAFVGVSGMLIKNGRLRLKDNAQRRRGKEQSIVNHPELFVWLCCAIGLSGLLLTTSASNFIWQMLTPLQGVQFPWRLLDIPVFWLSFGTGWLGSLLVPQKGNLWGGRIGVFLLLGVMLANAAAFLTPPRTSLLPKRPSIADATAVQQQFAIYGLTAWGEYSSFTVRKWPPALPKAGADQMAPLASKLPEPPENWEVVQSSSWQLAFEIETETALELLLNVHYFPGWRLRIDGEPVSLAIEPPGVLMLPIPAGKHFVELDFMSTPLRTAGNWISLITAVLIAAFFFFPKRVHWKKEQTQHRDAEGAEGWEQSLVWSILFLLIIKLAVLDQISTPLIRHPVDNQIPNTFQPEFVDFGEVMLLGAEMQAADELVLFWQANEMPSEPYQVVVTLLDGRGVPVKELVNRHPGFNVMTAWEPRQLIRDVYTIPLDLVEPPVAYDLTVGLQTADGEQKRLLLDAPFDVDGVWVGSVKREPPVWESEKTAVSENANFNNQIALKASTVPEMVVERPFTFDLVWESLVPVEIDYNIFIHLINADDEIVDQSDGPPLGGIYPTSAWEAGEIVVDSRQWSINAPPGRYRLQVGIYDLETGNRLPVTGDGALGDRFVIGEIEIR